MRPLSCTALLILAAAICIGQEPAAKTSQPSGAPAAAKPVLSPSARLQAAKTAYVKNVEGTSIGSDTILTTLEGWGRYKVVDSPDKADLMIEVTSPSETEGGVSISSSTSTASGKYEQSNKSTRELSPGGGAMRLVVRDAKTGSTLWFSSEQVKGALKKNARENNLVEAAQKLVSKFRQRVEPMKNAE